MAVLVSLAGPYAAGAGGDEDVDAYVDLIARYRRDRERPDAVRALMGWPLTLVRDAARGLDARGAVPQVRLAAMLLHGDVGMLARRRGETKLSKYHFQVGLMIVGSSVDGDSERRARRWALAIGIFQASNGDVEEAIAFLDRALLRFSGDPLLLLARGQLEEFLSTPHFRGWAPGLPRGPDRGRSAVEAVRESSEMRARLSRAEAAYRNALAVDPTLLEARLHLGRIQAVRGQLAEARESLEAVLSARPPPEAYLVYMASLLLGGLHESAGDLERAAACYRDAVHADPQSQVAVLALAHATHRLGRRHESAEMVKAFLSKAGNRPHTDGWWAFRMGPLADEDRVGVILQEIRAGIAE